MFEAADEDLRRADLNAALGGDLFRCQAFFLEAEDCAVRYSFAALLAQDAFDLVAYLRIHAADVSGGDSRRTCLIPS